MIDGSTSEESATSRACDDDKCPTPNLNPQEGDSGRRLIENSPSGSKIPGKIDGGPVWNNRGI